MTTILLCHNDIGDHGAKSLAKKWLGRSDCRLSWLSLTSNGIGSDGAEDVAEALATNTSLTDVYLTVADNAWSMVKNFIGQEGWVPTAYLKSLDVVTPVSAEQQTPSPVSSEQ